MMSRKPNMTRFLQLKINFTERFKRRKPLRLHMTLILVATACSGFLATRIMLALHLENVLVRYPLAVVCAYLVFFLSMKLWLKYVAVSPTEHRTPDNAADLIDVLPDVPGIWTGGDFPGGDALLSGGGGFSGGGASGSFGEAFATVADSGADAVSSGVDMGRGIGDSIGDAAGDALSGLGDEGGVAAVVIFAVLAALGAVLVGAGLYLVYEAPFILSEAAFEFVLAASLVRGSRRIDSGDWVGSVFRTTVIPFTVTLALALLAGYLMHHYFPGVTRISELFSRL
jgi:hypothetical protein